ncbi:MAG: hypothetical protein IBJ09_12070 [Bacteroidia bacterium]|nr:hypothetical protein [Bacteroidia bacterium]
MYRSNEGPGWLTLVMNRFPAERTARPLSERVVSVLSGAEGTGKPPVFIWRKGDVVFYLVAPSESEARRALGALGAPGAMRAFDPDRAWTKQYSGGHE